MSLEFGVVGSRLVGRAGTPLCGLLKMIFFPKGALMLMVRKTFAISKPSTSTDCPKAEALRILGVDEKGNDIRGKSAAAADASAAATSTPPVAR